MENIVALGNHYLYRHVRKDKDEVFYIGVGTKVRRDKNLYPYNRAIVYHYNNRIWDNIVSKTEYDIEILFETDNYEYAKQKEQEFIKLYGRIDLGTGTLSNLTDGGDATKGWKPSDETKEKIRRKNMGQGLGIPLSEEHKKKIGDAQKGVKNHMYGKKVSDETKLKMSKTRKGKKFSEKVCKERSERLKGHYVSQETKDKIAEKAKNYTHIPFTGKAVIDTKTGKIYQSVAKASEDYKFSVVSLKNKLKGKFKNDTTFIYLSNQL